MKHFSVLISNYINIFFSFILFKNMLINLVKLHLSLVSGQSFIKSHLFITVLFILKANIVD